MLENITESNNLIKKYEAIAICIPSIKSLDVTYALVSLYQLLRSMNKKVCIVVNTEPEKKYASIFKSNNITLINEIKPLSYVVTIDYGSTAIEKVSWETDEKNGKINFFIVPSSGQFNFDNIEYSKNGGDYKLTIVFDVNDLNDMPEVLSKSDYIFRKNKIISLGRGVGKIGDVRFELSEKESYCEIIYELLKSNSSNFSEKSLEMLLKGVLDFHKILEKNPNENAWNIIGSIVKYGGNFRKAFDSIYFSKSYSNLDLQIKLMHNIRVDKKARVIWSGISAEDLKFCGIDKENIDINGRIEFNISSDFDLAISAYELEKGVIKGVVESNAPQKYSAIKLAAVFEGSGDDYHADFELREIPIRDFEKRFFSVLHDVYGIEVKSHGISFSTTPVVSDSPVSSQNTNNNSKEVLTRPLQYSKNDGLGTTSNQEKTDSVE